MYRSTKVVQRATVHSGYSRFRRPGVGVAHDVRQNCPYRSVVHTVPTVYGRFGAGQGAGFWCTAGAAGGVRRVYGRRWSIGAGSGQSVVYGRFRRPGVGVRRCTAGLAKSNQSTTVYGRCAVRKVQRTAPPGGLDSSEQVRTGLPACSSPVLQPLSSPGRRGQYVPNSVRQVYSRCVEQYTAGVLYTVLSGLLLQAGQSIALQYRTASLSSLALSVLPLQPWTVPGRRGPARRGTASWSILLLSTATPPGGQRLYRTPQTDSP